MNTKKNLKNVTKQLNLTLNYTENLYKVIDKNEYESLCNTCTKYVDETTRNASFLKIWI